MHIKLVQLEGLLSFISCITLPGTIYMDFLLTYSTERLFHFALLSDVSCEFILQCQKMTGPEFFTDNVTHQKYFWKKVQSESGKYIIFKA
jgi:hypothetical protein